MDTAVSVKLTLSLVKWTSNDVYICCLNFKCTRTLVFKLS